VDGKHVLLRRPACSGSQYYDYKGNYSFNLLALCDSRYRLIFCSFGSFGSSRDAGIYDRSPFKDMLEDGSLNFPPPECLPNSQIKLPFFIIGDSAFPLSHYLMKPYPSSVTRDFTMGKKERIYNYRYFWPTKMN
jgi:hypothetical protein